MALPRHSSDHMKHSSSISDLLAIAEMPSISMTRSRSTPMSLNAMNEGLNDGAGTTNFEEPHVPSLLLNLTSTMLYMTNYYMILPTSSKYLLTLGGKVSSNAAFATNHNDPAARHSQKKTHNEPVATYSQKGPIMTQQQHRAKKYP